MRCSAAGVIKDKDGDCPILSGTNKDKQAKCPGPGQVNKRCARNLDWSWAHTMCSVSEQTPP
ncbi:hypothetical protein GCM10009087_04910 [Sphingomonas oligophenolica]